MSLLQPLPSAFRGIYHRVARRLGVDPSYVSRVARQERHSPEISAELKKEVDRILRDSRNVLVQSVTAQLELASTFCHWARNARSKGEADGSSLTYARHATESALRTLAKLKLEPEEFAKFHDKAERLKAELQSLDGNFSAPIPFDPASKSRKSLKQAKQDDLRL